VDKCRLARSSHQIHCGVVIFTSPRFDAWQHCETVEQEFGGAHLHTASLIVKSHHYTTAMFAVDRIACAQLKSKKATLQNVRKDGIQSPHNVVAILQPGDDAGDSVPLCGRKSEEDKVSDRDVSSPAPRWRPQGPDYRLASFSSVQCCLKDMQHHSNIDNGLHTRRMVRE
jgi:hypothetical protein